MSTEERRCMTADRKHVGNIRKLGQPKTTWRNMVEKKLQKQIEQIVNKMENAVNS